MNFEYNKKMAVALRLEKQEKMAKLFITESNFIEGITRKPTQDEIDMHVKFLSSEEVTMELLQDFVNVYQPTAQIRYIIGMNVRVGSYIAPPGGREVVQGLDNILQKINLIEDPYNTHLDFETLHPYTDCNGRLGRVIWAWGMYNMTGIFMDRFLQVFYYQTLERYGGRKNAH
jgi:Fic family protein